MFRPFTLSLLAVSVFAQTPRPSFEVVSIKPNRSGETRFTQSNYSQPGNRYTATNISLDQLIANAYSLPIVQTTGWPKWIYSARYDIEAVAEGNPTGDQKILMLQSLLADRFKLVIRKETQQRPIYALMVVKEGKLGPGIHPHTNDSQCRDAAAPGPPPNDPSALPICGRAILRSGHIVAQGITISALGRIYNGQLGRVVIDRTGLTGTWDLTLDNFTTPAVALAGDPATENPSAVSYFTAFREQLGLKFESTAGPVEMYLIDHVEEPSEN